MEVTAKYRSKVKDPNQIYKCTCWNCGEKTSYTVSSRPELCPSCCAEFWDKPADELKLFNLQKQFLNTQDNTVLGLMYLALKDYSANMIKDRSKSLKTFTKDFIESASSECALRVIQQYLSKPNYKVNASFGGNLGWVINGVLHEDQDYDKHWSLDENFDGDDSFIDSLGKDGLAHEYHRFIHDPTPDLRNVKCSDEVLDLIESVRKAIQNNLGTSKSLNYLIIFFHKTKRRHPRYVELYYDWIGKDNRDVFEKAELVIHSYLKESLL
jgi:hypothetical protein